MKIIEKDKELILGRVKYKLNSIINKEYFVYPYKRIYEILFQENKIREKIYYLINFINSYNKGVFYINSENLNFLYVAHDISKHGFKLNYHYKKDNILDSYNTKFELAKNQIELTNNNKIEILSNKIVVNMLEQSKYINELALYQYIIETERYLFEQNVDLNLLK